MTDPYKVLGVSYNATDDEIKKAYRELVKKYHPDNYHNSPLADLANEKMQEINEAYDIIQKQRAAGSSHSGFGRQNQGGSSQNANSNLVRVRQLISEGRYAESEIVLDSVLSSERGAEWHFLKGIICAQRGNHFDAAGHIKRACEIDPYNAEYRDAYNKIKNMQANYGGYNTSRTSGGGCSTCDICTGLLCADCLCECCGGDIISCC